MKEWYSDNKIGIFFNIVPCIGIRYATPSMTDKEIESIKKYPFINKKNLTVKLIDNKKQQTYVFDIPKGYCFDGASVPWLFRRIIGAPTDNSFLVAAMVHDVLCENHGFVNNDRAFSTLAFDSLLKVSEVSRFKRFLMKNSVDIFQALFCDWGLEYNNG